MSDPKIGYVAESGFQHLFPVLAMLPELPGPLFTTGKRIASRANSLTEVIHSKKGDLSKELANRNIDIVLTTSQRIEPELLKTESPDLKVAFINHGESHKTHSGGFKAQKAFVHSEVNDQFDLILVASRPHANSYKNENKVNTGYLKHDLFLKHGYSDRPTNKNWVLWAPTWGRHSSLRHWLDSVVQVTQKLNLNLIIHPHPFSFVAEPAIIQKAQIEVVKNKHVKIAQCANLLDAMAPAVLMLGDVSTSCFDWLMFDRPIVFLDHKSLVIPSEKALFDVGDVVKQNDVNNLEETLVSNLAHPSEKSSLRKEALNQHFFRLDGSAAKRVRDSVYHKWRTEWKT